MNKDTLKFAGYLVMLGGLVLIVTATSGKLVRKAAATSPI